MTRGSLLNRLPLNPRPRRQFVVHDVVSLTFRAFMESVFVDGCSFDSVSVLQHGNACPSQYCQFVTFDENEPFCWRAAMISLPGVSSLFVLAFV
jgi:hypothetical protein